MAQDNVEIVRGIYERWGRGDFRADAELFDPWAVLVLRKEFPDAGAYLGLEGISKYMRGFLESWDDAVIEGEEVIAAGDSVVVRVHQQAAGKQSGTPVDMRYFQVWTFRGGRVIRLESFSAREEALRAAGLREEESAQRAPAASCASGLSRSSAVQAEQRFHRLDHRGGFGTQPAVGHSEDAVAHLLKGGIADPIALEGRAGAVEGVPVQLDDQPFARPQHVHLHVRHGGVDPGSRQSRVAAQIEEAALELRPGHGSGAAVGGNEGKKRAQATPAAASVE